ncbi:uncharacterized protein HD556DRAFT_1031776 [Suillus plorans]|uniref:Secreted protein n=1 Tax=Suillus plorans TaxID=116603 RepID=A0A9P7J355_9AGAM|nr:uncharacterized protein HD556DRAFT_1031776 [Suillus plorans]KAG1800377.1 hypothetical protein HD556DRAFT_1031776 [Suillus plorans]
MKASLGIRLALACFSFERAVSLAVIRWIYAPRCADPIIISIHGPRPFSYVHCSTRLSSCYRPSSRSVCLTGLNNICEHIVIRFPGSPRLLGDFSCCYKLVLC